MRAIPHRNPRRGVTLAEVIVSIPLVGLVLVGALQTTGGALATWNFAQENRRGLGLAEHLMAEILQQPYEDPDGAATFGPEIGEAVVNRHNWDDVDDYNGWTKSPPQQKSGVLIGGMVGWSRAVSVALVKRSDPTQSAVSDEGLKRITVTVTDPDGATLTLVAYRSAAGALEQSPALDATLQSYVKFELDVGDYPLHSGARMVNHAEDE